VIKISRRDGGGMNSNKKKLIFSLTKKDFRVDKFKSGGKGGQNQNKRDTGVRIIHVESGIASECREERSQEQNKRKAFRKLCENPKFRLWIKKRAFELENDIDKLVDEQMRDQYLKVEYFIPS
jgi:protein subunit release factor A